VTLAPTANIDQIEDALLKTIQGRFKGDVAGVKTLTDLDKLEARIGIVRRSDEFADTPDAFSLVDADLAARRHALRAEALGTDASKLLGELQGAHTSITVATLREAVSHFRSLGRKVPELRPNWIITRHTVECLERIIRELRFQRESGQGILILEGEAGTGKNVLIDLLAHLSKHERFLFACNFQTQKEDFTYEYAFTPQKGTFRVSAKLLEKLVTPYSFNAFDEINTLPPGVLKMLNALLDERRTLYLPDGRELPVDSTSYLVGFMNPRHYIGTQELSPEIVSRATFVQIPYPPEKRAVKGKDLYAPDEALMLSRSVRGLSSIPQEEFEKAWDAIVNKVSDKPVSISPDQERLIQGLHTVVKVANAVRRQYTNFQTNQGTQQMDFVFCLRTGASIARRLKPDSNVREIIKEVVLPKISSHESKTNAEMLITTT
jgi:hypothetical protein